MTKREYKYTHRRRSNRVIFRQFFIPNHDVWDIDRTKPFWGIMIPTKGVTHWRGKPIPNPNFTTTMTETDEIGKYIWERHDYRDGVEVKP